MQIEGGWACLLPWIICVIIGKIVMLFGKDKDGNKSIILEEVVDQRLWIWQAYFGLLGGNNDLNVLNKSLLIWDLLGGLRCQP
jgi:hypothetical protein